MRTNYVLIDFESVQVKSLELLKNEHFRVYIFLGPTNSKLPREVVLAVQKLVGRADYIELDTPGPNALDFHIAYYIGALSKTDPRGYFHIISKDSGFDPLIKHLKKLDILAARSASIEDMPCFKATGESGEMVALEALIDHAVSNLAKRKAGLPKTVETLKRTLRASHPHKPDGAVLDSVIAGLLKRNHLRMDGGKLAYSLPGAAGE
jgi:hypothetical protein